MVLKNLNKHIILGILLCFGFFLMPTLGYGCTKKTVRTEHQNYSNKQSHKTEIKDCCKTKSCKSDKDHSDCDGKCKDSSCRCSTTSYSLNLHIPVDIHTVNQFGEIKQEKFGFEQACYSSGFSSIWQPPKIG